MLLDILQCTQQHPTTNNYSAHELMVLRPRHCAQEIGAKTYT